MNNYNVLAVLTPHDEENLAASAFRLPQNKHCRRRCKAVGTIAEEPTISSRDPTPAPDPTTDCIVLTLEGKTGDWTAGTDPCRDVVLGCRGTKGISGNHFSITIDDNYWIWLVGHSRFGTSLSYDGDAGEEHRLNDKWILARQPGAPKICDKLVVYVPYAGGLGFTIEFPNHHTPQPDYSKKLCLWLSDNNNNPALPPIDGLGLESIPITEEPSENQTPNEGPVYVKVSNLGSETYKVMRPRSGDFCVLKASRRKPERDETWLKDLRNEMKIIELNPHRNVMSIIEFGVTPEPFLVMPFYARGNLHAIRLINQSQCCKAFRQILLGVYHLHTHGISHRNLKPSNLFVQDPFTIVIGGFGLSRDLATNMQTFSGAHMYAAPEIFDGSGQILRNQWLLTGMQADIWSIGVIMLELLKYLPGTPHDLDNLWEFHKSWSATLISQARNLEDVDVRMSDILVDMLKPEPEERLTLKKCLDRGCDNGLFRRLDGEVIDGDERSYIFTVGLVRELARLENEELSGSIPPTRCHSEMPEQEKIPSPLSSIPRGNNLPQREMLRRSGRILKAPDRYQA